MKKALSSAEIRARKRERHRKEKLARRKRIKATILSCIFGILLFIAAYIAGVMFLQTLNN